MVPMETKLIGRKIAEARKKLNISQARLAEQLFISPQAVGKWERGESIPDIITFGRLAEILGVDLNYFSESFQSANSETALKSAGDGNDTFVQSEPGADSLPRPAEHPVQIKFSAADFKEGDFAGVTLHKGKFKTSALRGADFSGADLTGSSFDVSDAHEAIFDRANLTDCRFSITDLTGAQFNKTILVRTEFNKLGLARAKFTGVNLIDVKLNMTDLSNTIFENCTFTGVHFLHSGLQGLCLDGLTFTDVRFDKSQLNDVSFRGATLKNVSFTVPFSVTNKQYLAMKTICFDGARMDKLTYIALKGLGVIDLSKVIVI